MRLAQHLPKTGDNGHLSPHLCYSLPMPRKIKQIKTGKPVKIGFYLDAEANEKLEQLSRRTMAPKARLLRKAVLLLLKEYK